MGSQLEVALMSAKYLHSFCKTFNIIIISNLMINYVFVYLVFAKERYLLTISLTKTAKPFKILRWDGTKMFRPRVCRRRRHLCNSYSNFKV